MTSAPHRPPERGEDGSAVLEFALVSLVLLAILYGIITYGMIFAVQHTLSAAAAEGARAAVGAPAGEEVVVSAMATRSAIGWLDRWVDAGDVSAAVAGCAHDTTETCVQVRIDYPYGARPVLPPFPLVGLLAPDVIRTEAVATVG